MKLGTTTIKRIGIGAVAILGGFLGYTSLTQAPDREPPDTLDSVAYPLYQPAGEWDNWAIDPPTLPDATVLSPPAYTANLAGPVYNVVTDYGADPTGETDSREEIQNAITACGVAGGGTVYIPAGLYTAWPAAAYHIDTNPRPTCWTIYYPNVTIEGAGPTLTNLSIRAPSGVDPNSAIMVRGGGFTTLGVPRNLSNVTFRGFRITGNAGITADAGDYSGEAGSLTGWDTNHKAFAIYSSAYTVTSFIFEFLEVDNWRGEQLYTGGSGLGSFTVRDCLIRDCNASAVSMGGSLVQEDSYTYKVLQGTENFCRDGESMVFRRNVVIPNKDLPAEMLIGASGAVYHGFSDASLLVENNTFGYGYNGAVFCSEFATDVTIQDNTFNDGVGVYALNQGQYTAIADESEYQFKDWIIQRNSFNAVTRTIPHAILTYDPLNEDPFDNVLIDDNVTTHSGGNVVTTFVGIASFTGPWTVSNNTIAGGTPIQGHFGPRATYTTNTLGGDLVNGTTFGNADDTQTPLAIAPAWPKINITQIGPIYSRPIEISPGVVALFPDGYTIEIRRDGANNIYRGAEIQPDSDWNSLARGYMIFKGAVLVLEKNGTTGKMDFVSFTERDNDSEVANVYDNEGSIIKFFGKTSQNVVPANPFSYDTFSGVAIGATVTINHNANVTIEHTAGVIEMWNSVDFVASGSGTLYATRVGDVLEISNTPP